MVEYLSQADGRQWQAKPEDSFAATAAVVDRRRNYSRSAKLELRKIDEDRVVVGARDGRQLRSPHASPNNAVGAIGFSTCPLRPPESQHQQPMTMSP